MSGSTNSFHRARNQVPLAPLRQQCNALAAAMIDFVDQLGILIMPMQSATVSFRGAAAACARLESCNGDRWSDIHIPSRD
jgi:hypothetical protein